MSPEKTIPPATRPWSFARTAPAVADCAAALLLVFLYYWRVWGTVQNFIVCLDHNELLFSDFQNVYYPIARTILDTHQPVPGYYYSAFFALALYPLGQLALAPACALWGAGQVLFTLLLFALPLRCLLKLSAAGLAGCLILFLTSVPLLHNFSWGQVSVPLTLLVLASFHAHARGRPVLAGALLALGAAIKYYPALFLVYFLLRRQWRACASFAMAGLLFFAVLPIIALGPAGWLGFQQSVMERTLASDWVARDINSQYFGHVATRLAYFFNPQSTAPVLHPAFKMLGWGIAALNLGVLLLLNRRGRPDDPALSAALIFLTLPLLLKTSWPHYFVYLAFCQTLLLTRTAPRARAVAQAPCPLYCRLGACATLPILLSCALSSVFILNLWRDWAIYSSLGALLISDLLLLPAAYGLARSQTLTSEDGAERAGMTLTRTFI